MTVGGKLTQQLKRSQKCAVAGVADDDGDVGNGDDDNGARIAWSSSKCNHPIVMIKVVADIQLIFDNCRAYNRSHMPTQNIKTI